MSNFSSDLLENILYKINNSSDYDIKKIMYYYIYKAMKKCKEMNFDTDTIGYKSDINKSIPDIMNLNIDGIRIQGTSFWIGFIPKDIKIVYDFEIKNFRITNNGYYYYINDYNYIYDFAKYIKNKKINNDLSFLIKVHDFIYDYFFTIYNTIDREQLHQLIYDVNGNFYKPNKEHNLTDFKRNNSAKCSEYASMLQNIMSTFGYEIVYMHGEVDDHKEKKVSHAFNLGVIENEYSIIDISMPINCFDENLNIRKRFPYVCCMNKFNENNLERFLIGEEEVELDDLEAHIINKECYSFPMTRKRVYRVDSLEFD